MSEPLRSRTASRHVALQMLFSAEFCKTEAPWSIESLRTLTSLQEQLVQTADMEFAKFLVDEVGRKQTDLDKKIQSASQHWKVQRMGLIDRNILRIAVCELTIEPSNTPPKVVVNEAIELAKTFGETDSSKFVNGILDRLAQPYLS